MDDCENKTRIIELSNECEHKNSGLPENEKIKKNI